MSDEHLKRSLTLVDATAIVVGSMIGSGIFLKAGGLYVYLCRAYGPFVGFLFGWSLLAVLQTGSIAGLAAGAVQSLSVLIPGVANYHFWLAGSLILLLTTLNVVSLKSSARVQNVLTLAKVLGIFGLVGGALLLGHASTTNLAPPSTPLATAGLLGAIGISVTKALWAYDGWVNLGFVAGELKTPQKNLPRAIAIGVGLVITVYVVTNAVYHLVLPLEVVQQSPSVAVEVAKKLLGEPGTLAMSILTFVSMAGALNSSILSAPRVYYAMAQDGKFPKAIGAVHSSFRTPYVALIVQGFWSVCLLYWWGKFETLTDNVVFVFWIFYALGAGAVIRLRYKEPHTDRPYTAVGYPWVPIIFMAAAILLTTNTLLQAPAQSAQALLLVLTGAILYPIRRLL